MDEYTYTGRRWLHLLVCVIRAWWQVSVTRTVATCNARSRQNREKFALTDEKLDPPRVQSIVRKVVPCLNEGD